MKKWGLWIASLLVVTIVFHLCYGLQVLLPSNVSWLMTIMHDWGAHYIGWDFYKNEPWHFPIGQVNDYFYPIGTNVGFTDSIPLMAILFKMCSHLLPSDFQYFGIWLFACHLLAAYYTIKLFRLFKVKDIYTFIGVIFVAANPVLIYRGMHPALCAHWLFIGSVYVYFLNPAVVSPAKILRHQFILLLLSSLINPYLCFMVLGFSFVIVAKLCFWQKAITKWRAARHTVVSLVSLLLCWYIVGMVTFGKKEDLDVQNAFGLYGLNLNSLYNSFGFSTFFPQLKWVSDHQYEGFMYLGLGMFLLFAILLVYAVVKRVKPRFSIQHTTLIPLFILVILLTLFSITHVVTLNDKVLFRMPAPKFIAYFGEVFRATARFFWPVYYLIFFFVLIAIAKSRLPQYAKLAILGIAIILQLYDTKRMFTYRHLTYGSYTPPISAGWGLLMNKFDEVVFYPPCQMSNLTNLDYQYFAYLAAEYRKKINTGYVARVDNGAVRRYSDSLITIFAEGKLSPRTLYITTPANLSYFSFSLQADSGQLHYMDGYYYMISSQRKDADSLAHALSAPYAAKIDSALNQIARKTVIEKVNATETTRQGPVRHFIESYSDREGSVYLAGWAFDSIVNNNKEDSIFITLRNDTSLYIAAANLQARPDVTSFFKKQYLDNAGFSVQLFKNRLEKGNYSLGIAIKHRNGDIIYALTDKTIQVGEQYAIPENMDSISAGQDILFNAETFAIDATTVTASGWAYIKDRDADRSKIGLVVKNKSGMYLIWTDPVPRPDVTAYFKNVYNFNNSGYTVKFLKQSFAPGDYQVGILIRNSKWKKDYLVFTGKEISL